MSAVTFHAVCPPSNRRKDGTIPVRIRVTWHGIHRYLPTNLIAYPSDLTRSSKIKNPTITARAGELVKQMQDTLASVTPFEMESWTIDQIVAHIRSEMSGQSFRLDFFAFADTYLDGKGASTRRAYDTALHALERYLGERRLDINDITKALLLEFVAAVDAERKMSYNPRSGEWKETDKPKGRGQSSRHLMKLAHIFNAAKLKYNDEDTGRVLIPRSPFDHIPRDYGQPDGQQPLPLDVMQRLIRSEARGVDRIALDAFILSFGTMGANLADLYAATPFTGQWRYFRKKITSRKAEMRVDIQPEMLPVAARLKGRGPYWLNALHRIAPTANICTSKVNASLRRIAEREGLEPFTFYAARKSWATYARNLAHIEKATVDEALAHKGDYSIADIYIAKSWTHLNEANRKVLDLLTWHD